ncbi:QRFP-like peptide receptor [Argopecten irradians]|uniref:QRFP-like peptide receptor n=1 Tax=Argopecten irradians TaxID=31199 RepID=UPI0037166A55
MFGNTTLNETDVYDYDYNSSMGYLPLKELLPVSMVYGITLLFGLVGNVLVIVSVARFKKMQNVTNVFLLSLATADLLLVVVCIPVKCVAFFSYTWHFGEVLCKLVNYLQNISIICSVMNLTGLSLERYYAIMHPMKAKCVCTMTLAKKTVIAIWVFGSVLALPTLVVQNHERVGHRQIAYWCVLNQENATYRMMHGIYMFLIILVIPFSLMSFAYTSICRRLWLMRYHRTDATNYIGEEDSRSYTGILRKASSGPRCQRNGEVLMVLRSRKSPIGEENQTRKQVIKMLVAIVLLFLLCWGPIMCNNLLVSLGILDDLHFGYLKPMRQLFLLMSYFNSCVNPVVYGFMSKNFRNSFRNTLALVCGHQTVMTVNDNGVVRYSFQTRSTSFISGRPNLQLQDYTGDKIKTAVHEVET